MHTTGIESMALQEQTDVQYADMTRKPNSIPSYQRWGRDTRLRVATRTRVGGSQFVKIRSSSCSLKRSNQKHGVSVNKSWGDAV